MQRHKEWLVWILKGLAMGACDVVPGVSGGTIAFITGIYDRLLNALRQFTPALILLFFKEGLKSVWEKIDGNFLLCLIIGIGSSIFGSTYLILYLLKYYPIYLWSFFFGLILVSGYAMSKQVDHRNFFTLISLLLGIALAYNLGMMVSKTININFLTIFFSGVLAICAMILPGISGSFILLMLGMYGPILLAVKTLDIYTLSIFSGGCVLGLLCFSHILSWLLRSYRNITISFLTGLMIGALGKIWPWKQVLQTRINSAGEEVPFIQINVSPFRYQELTGMDAHWMISFFIMFVVVAVFILISRNFSFSKAGP